MSKNGGFITLHRKMQSWEWFKNPTTFCLFVHLLMMANFTDGQFEGMPVSRGMLVTSIAALCEETGLTVQNVRTALSKLVSTGEITNKSTNKYRVITIVKYDQYQSVTEQITSNQQTTNKQITSNQQTTNKQAACESQQYNNEYIYNKGTRKQGNNKYTHSGDSYPEAFEAFWAVYPKRVAKQDALKAWNKLRLNDELINQIMASLARWAGSEQWSREGGRFIPNAATWLNGRRWEDEVRKEPPAPAATVGRRVAAQEYSQRGYSSEHDDAMQRMIAMMQGREEP